jgi:MFS transporter, DHA2 family, methylenomycin A resistance protein
MQQREMDTGTTDVANAASSHRALGLVAICAGFFVIQLDATVVNVALPAIARDLNSGLSQLQWVIDAYTLTFAGCMLTAGSLGDRLGARRVFIAGLAVFTVGSLGCSLAPSLGVLLGTRVVQGIGAAALLPSSLALIVHEYSGHRDRARALGLWGAAGSVGVALGPVLGGALIAIFGWRAIFLINVPVGLLAFVLLRTSVRETDRRPPERVDWPGLGWSLAAISLVTAAFIEAGTSHWRSAVPVIILGAGLLCAVAFLRTERRAISPMLPLDLFRSRPFSSAVLVGACFNLSLYGALLCLSIYLQQTRSSTALDTGLLLLPMAGLVAGGSLLSGWLTGRHGHRLPLVVGLLTAAAGALVLAWVGPTTPITVLVAGTLGLGLISVAMPAMSSLAVGAAPADRAGLASGILNTARQSGGAFGVAVLGSLLALSSSSARHYTLALPLLIAVAVLVAATVAAWLGTRGEAT